MRTPAAVPLLVAALGAASCSPAAAPPVAVLAASSLAPALERLDADARINPGSSRALATQLREGAPADVFASADPALAAALAAEGLTDAPVTVATNRIAIIVGRSSPIRSVQDLRAPGVRVVLAARGVPAGDYAREALTRLGAADVAARALSEEDDARAVAGKVAVGEADAGLAYVTDAAAAPGRLRAIELPDVAQPAVAYTLSVVRAGRRAHAEAFVRRVRGPEGRAALRDAGFGLP